MVFVMAGHSRPKDGVASARLCPAIHVFLSGRTKTWMPGTRPGMTQSVLPYRTAIAAMNSAKASVDVTVRK
jgi:hypothetical protein